MSRLMMTSPLFRALTLVSLIGDPAGLTPSEYMPGSVTFHVVDPYGEPIRPVPYYVASLKSLAKLDMGKEYSHSPKGLVVDNLSPREYEYKLAPINRDQFSDVGGRVFVGRGEKRWVAVVASQKAPIQASYRIPDGGFEAGIVSPSPSKQRLMWIMLIQAFDGTICEQNRVEDTGLFRFYWRHTGKFLLIVYRETEIVYTKPITLNGAVREPLRIDLRNVER